jgi:hypothetical protein
MKVLRPAAKAVLLESLDTLKVAQDALHPFRGGRDDGSLWSDGFPEGKAPRANWQVTITNARKALGAAIGALVVDNCPSLGPPDLSTSDTQRRWCSNLGAQPRETDYHLGSTRFPHLVSSAAVKVKCRVARPGHRPLLLRDFGQGESG